ncbi:MAG: cytochrome c biogenesis protein CcdA [Thermodesulfovibrionales bacterium]|nr:cytochrome c biogenesis protein CcdA [Thermodesulfovibrionales bacterium]
MKDVSLPLAFLAGVVSFLSPCVLPLIPSYISYITGLSFKDLTESPERARIRKVTLVNSLAFVAGFTVVFVLLGASSTTIGRLFFQYRDVLSVAGGILIIIFGLFVAGILNLNFLMRERRFELKDRPAGLFGSFFIGMTFGAGWTPCIGPVLGSILIYASTKDSVLYGMGLLGVYSIGLGLPFVISALAINIFLSYIKKIQRYMRYVMLLSGLILIAFGIMLITGSLGLISQYMPDIGIKL